jgi:hypothetical protein
MSKPLRATNHCRHYSYSPGLSGGPCCAAGVDMSQPGSSARCMPDPKGACGKREDFTDAERADWKAYVDGRLMKMAEAVAAIPASIPCGTTGEYKCPLCPGELRWSRASNGHVWLSCTALDCVGPVHFNIDRKTSWPASAGAAA